MESNLRRYCTSWHTSQWAHQLERRLSSLAPHICDRPFPLLRVPWQITFLSYPKLIGPRVPGSWMGFSTGQWISSLAVEYLHHSWSHSAVFEPHRPTWTPHFGHSLRRGEVWLNWDHLLSHWAKILHFEEQVQLWYRQNWPMSQA